MTIIKFVLTAVLKDCATDEGNGFKLAIPIIKSRGHFHCNDFPVY